MIFTEEGKVISVKDVQLAKADGPIVFKLDGISNVTCFNEEHSKNA